MQPANLDPEDPNVRAAVFGVQVQEWLKSPVGDHIVTQVRQKLERLTEQLKKQSPLGDGQVKVVGLQAEIRVWETFVAWLGNAVQEGLTAEAIIDGEQIDDT
jgi:hypothetical protein